jgi:hypothetical protein
LAPCDINLTIAAMKNAFRHFHYTCLHYIDRVKPHE